MNRLEDLLKPRSLMNLFIQFHNLFSLLLRNTFYILIKLSTRTIRFAFQTHATSYSYFWFITTNVVDSSTATVRSSTNVRVGKDFKRTKFSTVPVQRFNSRRFSLRYSTLHYERTIFAESERLALQPATARARYCYRDLLALRLFSEEFIFLDSDGFRFEQILYRRFGSDR
ncbi:unnamed protein product [Amoebophrya sp. A120]|nr:unnamed protein product [Amoebophrya sp. A120]|eukprot:GSA120T00008648001.1